MNGSQGEIAHIDLTDGNEIVRVLLEKAHTCPECYDDEDAYWGDVIRLTVGKAAPDTRVGSNWDGTIWNNRLEPIFQIEWADITGYRRNSDWYTDLEEGLRIQKLQRARSKNRRGFRNYTSTQLGDAYKSIALRWVQKQPRMKSCRLEDITSMTRRTRSDGRSMLNKFKTSIGKLAATPYHGAALRTDSAIMIAAGYRYIVVSPYLVEFLIAVTTSALP